MTTIVITGSDGQLGKCFSKIAYGIPNESYSIIYLNRYCCDISDKESVSRIFKSFKPDIVINCAAYTNVEKAENEFDKAHDINCTGVDELAYQCHLNNAYLITFSTDYVFDGNKNRPYKEDDETNPLNNYGITKRDGEVSALCYNNTLVIRTSWLFSEFEGNFFTKVLDKIKKGEKMKVVDDQTGCPTYAMELARSVMEIILSKKYIGKSGIYHYCNDGACSWFDFARSIEILYYYLIESDNTNYLIGRCSTEDFNSNANRPKYSVMDNSKYKEDFFDNILDWRQAMLKCLERCLEKNDH